MATQPDTTAKPESLSLKWGSVKDWSLDESGPAFAALKRWHESGKVMMSAALQRDNDEQKQAIYDLIDALNADTVYLDWDGKDVSKDEAKAYVREYRA